MAARQGAGMTLKECCRILGVARTARVDDVKRAYRRRAFELHPDLNPHMADAKRQFQLLNEAYVTLVRVLSQEEARAQRTKPESSFFGTRAETQTDQQKDKDTEKESAKESARNTGNNTGKDSGAAGNAADETGTTSAKGETGGKGEPGSKDATDSSTNQSTNNNTDNSSAGARNTRAKQQFSQDFRQEFSHDFRQNETTEQRSGHSWGQRASTSSERPFGQASGQTSGEASAQRSAETAGQPYEHSRQPHADTSADSSSSAHSANVDDSDNSSNSAETEARQRRMADAAYSQREDVLHDILNDQFARRVFEDIYSELNKKRPATKKLKAPEKAPPPKKPPQKRKLKLEWGDKLFNFDLSEGLGGMVRSWLRKQIDDTLTVRLPAARLFAGARVRLQIRQGLTQELRVIEVTLPPDFKSGKPIRLKGMGRKVGKWTGDLYLTIEAA